MRLNKKIKTKINNKNQTNKEHGVHGSDGDHFYQVVNWGLRRLGHHGELAHHPHHVVVDHRDVDYLAHVHHDER